ncbi:hypothetical protein K458DRAFT_451950 [Lentithecium fluviatile CBS 122367]|uniref:Zn(2)-C6 fungal-type domain-containing protein n=1 Tax=Lentithecium fluviatile CBS 122367 TaxID=1168545 RepID=A0A6G1J186_9PLEO|nr:hypothetical protein K458DRAFT_451950 [Lentithecium fluviatile CBS 122367]
MSSARIRFSLMQEKIFSPTVTMMTFEARPAPQFQPQSKHPSSASPAIHQYACLRCRSRRVKCDKILTGCAHCASHGAQCMYSARRPRKSKTTGLGQQQQRGQRCLLPASQSIAPSSISSVEPGSSLSSAEVASENEERIADQSADDEEDTIILQELREGLFEASKDRDGGLVVGPPGNPKILDGEVRKQATYFDTILSPKFSPNNENTQSGSFERLNTMDARSLLLNSCSIPKHNLHTNHPPPDVMQVLWDYYAHHVDRMAKVLYKPVVNALISRVSTNINSITTFEAPLLFAIWLAATISLSASECRRLHKQEKHILTRRYRRSLEDALIAAGWMTTSNILVLQALAIYLFFTSENSHSTWILSGIALGLAQIMGLHIDPSSSHPPPSIIETEMRRRLWWTLCQLDVRVSGNCGLEPHVPHTPLPPLPLHVNDSDLAPYSSQACNQEPLERDEFTDMTLALIKLEVTKTTLRFARSTSSQPKRQKIITDQLACYEHTYLRYIKNSPVPSPELQKICMLGTRFIMTRLWKMLYDTYPESCPRALYGEVEAPDPLITYNTDVLDIAHQLPCKYKQYGWFFRCKYSQWHALAYLLIQLCTHTTGGAVDRAWRVLDAVFADWEKSGLTGQSDEGDERDGKKKVVSKLWQPLLQLFDRAREARRCGLEGPTQHISVSVNKPSTLVNAYENTTNVNVTAPQSNLQRQPLPTVFPPSPTFHDGLIGDPFLGSADDFGMEMNWEQLDEWAKSFLNGYQQQREQNAVEPDLDMEEGFSWW